MPSAEIAITLEGFSGNPNGLFRYSFGATGVSVSIRGALAEALDADGANARARIAELEDALRGLLDALHLHDRADDMDMAAMYGLNNEQQAELFEAIDVARAARRQEPR